MFGKPASTLPCAAQIFDAVGQGVKRGVAVIGVGVEGEADICAEVVQSAGKDFGLCDHDAAGFADPGRRAEGRLFLPSCSPAPRRMPIPCGKVSGSQSSTRRSCHQIDGETSK